ncbi:hypothetical protein CC1G_12405 [Coprinopsis cinerea okayama7|uniref:Uncharacterized protein n=1 Tax=Coprinopsis cinerea (strain Okayama-7 / 130 / ATCC MYA-4618 / FGSC 9003) TaxID=240176 RepID=A8P362_COPC7|nr:hypothetical protein CC1G_12405 [Coprinopsis cinerea okayama7\|eukprot:XP_001838481.1 hypothetical protein CC1G_12405 [Coprinopsis cinerea okayama7\
MGRHRKYHTDEERKLANRKKSKAYYYRHHEEICSNCRKVKSRDNPGSSSSQKTSSTLPISPNSQEPQMKSNRFKDPKYWVQRALKQKEGVANLTDHQPLHKFLVDLCNDLAQANATQRGAAECIEEYLNGLAAIRKRVDTCHGYVLDLVGVGPDLSTVSSVYRAVDAVVRPLEEIEVMIMIDLDHFRREYSQNGITSFLN